VEGVGEGDGGEGDGDGGEGDGGEGDGGEGDGGEGDGGEVDVTVTTPRESGRVIVEIALAVSRVVEDSVNRTVWYWMIKVLTVEITILRITILACTEAISVALQV